MKISILLPYKENFTPDYAGAVSLFLNDTIKLSKYKKNIQVFGNTSFKKKLLTNYTNLKFTKFFFKSLKLSRFYLFQRFNSFPCYVVFMKFKGTWDSYHSYTCLLYTSPSPRDDVISRMPSSA